VFQWMRRTECYFINGTERVRYVERYIYHRQQYVHFDSDVGVFVGDTPYGEIQARCWNSQQEYLEDREAVVDWFCRKSYEVFTPFTVNRRVPPSSDQCIPRLSQCLPACLSRWCRRAPSPAPAPALLRDGFLPCPVQVRWFQDGQELPEHVVATDVVPNGDWTYQVLMPQDTVHSKILVGVGGFVLGFVFLALGLSFYLREKSS
ncbi:class II histocompatibility antigen, B-L beta chain-like, partial [Empidonax traillii]|uniref:class II histocompatibility antigen, B-L beta chain-like n=1 Tax=Empidonax traillii TaxID=164674 RepID=UPI000FFD767E